MYEVFAENEEKVKKLKIISKKYKTAFFISRKDAKKESPQSSIQ